ncbi:MAG: glycosyltransferase, partial [Cyanobacteria bacterium]|nr:glycosyltransferase [Cyanobacteriota bacterium]
MSLDPTSKIAEKLIHNAIKPAQGKPIPGVTFVSAVIITHNHEKVIDRCLKSLRWVDELVIVDLGSTDNTLTLVKEYPCQIYYYSTHPWTHEGFPLNFGFSMAQNEWILYLKPHEWLETQIKEEIHA